MTTLRKSLVIFVFVLLINQSLTAQVTNEVKLRDLPAGTTITLNQEFALPAGQTSLWLDSGKGKTCSCQFFGKDTGQETAYAKGQELTLRQISVKGLFDGSQMHVARVYFNETPNYFKFKCYARDIDAEHVSDYLTIEQDVDITKK